VFASIALLLIIALRLQAKILNDVEEQIEESAPEEITRCGDL